MAIAKRGGRKSDRSERLVAGTPDPKRPRWQKGSKTQITFTVAPELVDQLDEAANSRHVSRSALMTMWLVERLKQEAKEAA